VTKGTIIYIGNFNLPDKNASANRVVNNGKLFTALGYNVVFLGTDYSDAAKPGVNQLVNHADMFTQPHPVGTKQWIYHMFSVDNLLSFAERYADTVAVILYNAPYAFALRAKKAFKTKNIKVFYDCTEWTTDTDGSFPKRVVKILDEYLIRKHIHKQTDGMLVISNMMESAYTNSVPVLRIPPLIDSNNDIWHQEKIAHIGFEFLFAGIPDGNKEKLDSILSAFGSMPDNYYLRIIGVTKDEFISLYPDFLDNLPDHITFMGKLSHRETVKYVSSCDCYIFIRINDRRNNAGFPTKFAEAFTTGVPVITTAISDIPDYEGKSNNLIIIPDSSVSSVAKAMKIAINTEKKNTINNTFDFNEYLDTTAEWLKKVGLSDG